MGLEYLYPLNSLKSHFNQETLELLENNPIGPYINNFRYKEKRN